MHDQRGVVHVFTRERGRARTRGGEGERDVGLLLRMVKREMEPVSERKNWAAQ